MTRRLSVVVLGAGNWGTTLARIIGANGHDVALWSRDPRRCQEVNERHTNSVALPNVSLPESVHAVSEPEHALARSELVIFAVPAQSFRAVCREVCAALAPQHLAIHGTKGLETATLQRMSEILIGETCLRQVGALAGPNIAPELARGNPAGTVVASAFPRVIHVARAVLSCEYFMVFDSADMLGVEICGSLKNVVAIAAGMADEMQVGDNAKAFLLTRGVAEMMHLARAIGADAATVSGLAGVGDLMVTCSSQHSRNRRVGAALARGQDLATTVAELGMVAEGVYAAGAARALAKRYALRLPLFEGISRILDDGIDPHDVMKKLMQLPAGREHPELVARNLR